MARLRLLVLKTAGVLAAVFLVASLSWGQASEAVDREATRHDTSIASKDSRSLGVLSQMLRTTGWTKAPAPKDAVLTGTITRHYPEGPATSTVIMRLRGDGQYSYSEDGLVRSVVNGAAGAVAGPDGKMHRMPAHSALSNGNLFLPMSSTLLNWDGPKVDITFVGQSSINGESCIGIQLAGKHPDSKDDPLARVRRLIAPLTLWISTTRFVPVRADYYRVAADNHTATLRETAFFSDYRNVNGVAIPFRQDISIEGRLIYTYQFTAIEFNHGLSDADFNVAGVLGGAR
jgi:hypothetical protein